MAQKKLKTSFVDSKGFKNFMAKLYGIGAAIVIVGALFKIQHYPGANIMLPVGLGMEAIIFMFSAFQKPHVEPNWSKVYPQFLDSYHSAKEIKRLKDGGFIPQDTEVGTQYSAGGVMQGGGGSSSGIAEQMMDKILDKANINDEVIRRFGQGMERFAEQANSLKNITNASVATEDYVKNLNEVSSSAKKMTTSFNTAADKINDNIESTATYSENVKRVSDAANKLATLYERTSKDVESQESDYNTANRKLVDNLSALNSVYELQLKESNQQKDSTAKVSQGVNNFIKNLEASNDATAAYQKEVKVLSEKVSALNNVYGNMLSAMNVK